MTQSNGLRRQSAGQYATSDGRYRIEFEEWWLEDACECIMCQQGSGCPNGGDAKRSGWTVWDVAADDHLSGEPYEFETLRAARSYLNHHLAASAA